MKTSSVKYSVVIPARDEGEAIARCVRSVREFGPQDGVTEIIVVDNLSVDNTATLAREAGARVLHTDARTIGAVRNVGISAASGDVLVLLDADCVLTPEWQVHAPPILETIASEQLVCAGSQVFPPRHPHHLLWKHWFHPFAMQQNASHIGSAHLICRRRDLVAIGGFDESLRTGEDYDLCTRIVSEGGRLINVPALRVEHFGFPETIAAFIRRERWHGAGDVSTFRRFAYSRVAVVSLAVGVLIALALGAALMSRWALATIAAFCVAGLLATFSALKFRHAGLKTTAVASLLFLPYFAGRLLALYDRLAGQLKRDRTQL